MTEFFRTLSRRAGLKTLAAAALAAAAATPALAQDRFPSKPLTIVVPFVAGVTTDILARVVGQAMSEDLGQPVIIDNRAGAGGNIGGQHAARAPADGYTLFMGTVGTHSINEWLYAKMPFVIQPLQQAFAAVGRAPMEAAATLRASPWDAFFSVALPLARPGFVTAAVLGFAHTVGEFGVVLMIGGNIPGQTQVLSMAIYNHVEAMEYANAHWLAGGMLVFSFAVLMLLNSRGWNRSP